MVFELAALLLNALTLPAPQSADSTVVQGAVAFTQRADSDSVSRNASQGTSAAGPRLTQWSRVDLVAPAWRADTTLVERPDTTRRRRSFEYSDGYGNRLEIHKIGSYVMLPLFLSEYLVGQKLLNEEAVGTASHGLRGIHSALALGIGGVFGVNTITGVWNWWEGRKDPSDRTRRTLHSLIMLVSDVGFVWTAASAHSARRTTTGAENHRRIAIASISVSAVGTVMMWLWKK